MAWSGRPGRYRGLPSDAPNAGLGLAGDDRQATAYLPTFVAPFVSTNAVGFVLAVVTGVGLAFVLTLLSSIAAGRAPAVGGSV